MFRPRSLLFVALALLASVLALVSVASAQGTPTVGLRSTSLGSVLTNSQGRTLYVLTADSAGKSTCTGACATAWPPLTVKSGQTPAAGSGVTATLGTITRSDGTVQVTANGLPLYTFVRDAKARDVNGQGVNAFGGTWYVVNASGAMVRTARPAAAAAPATSKAPSTLPRTGGDVSGNLSLVLLAGLALIAFGGALGLRSARRAR